MSGMLLPAFGSAVLVAWAERLFSVRLGLPSTSLAVPAAYGLVVLVNGVAASFAVMSLGMRVGKSRKKYNYPAMYASGDSADAVKFNCIQRGHQQALETLPIFYVLSFVGGLKNPFLVSLSGAAWIIGRMKWATAYAELGPDKRYSSPWRATGSFSIWLSLIAQAVCSLSVAASLLLPSVF